MAEVLSCFDIIGPIMIGPSSSHTAGALRIAHLARHLAGGSIVQAHITLYGSFAHTYKGHGTDRALVGGLLGLETSDYRIRDSFDLAQEKGISISFDVDTHTEADHPNTVDIELTDTNGVVTLVRGESIGGGAAHIVRINGVGVEFSGEHNTVFVRQHDVAGVLAYIAQCFANCHINIASANMYREQRGQIAYTILETDESIPDGLLAALNAGEHIENALLVAAVNVVPSEGDDGASGVVAEEFNFTCGDELLRVCETHQLSIADAMRVRETKLFGISPEELDSRMHRCFEVMQRSITDALPGTQKSMGGLLGGESHALVELIESGKGVCGGLFAKVTAYSMAVLETNASMGRIVATPTAGSSGVVPGVLQALCEERALELPQCIDALFCAAAVGYIVARNACVSGAQGGCQAEIGVASAMAAAATTALYGGTPSQSLCAASIAMGNILGLVCDPVQGLVEEPCQKRNAMGASNALVSAQMALAGINSTIPFDEMVEVLNRVGRSLPYELRETALGGIAAAPSACATCASVGLCS